MTEQEKPVGIHAAVAKLLEQNLKKFGDGRDLNLLECTKIYQVIFESFVDVFKASNVQISNESMNYVAQQYYDGTLINGKHELDPEIFDKRAKLENIETKEIALLVTMLRGTDFALPLLHEIRQRS